MELPKRKNIRLRGYDYDTPGYYFITVCTKDKKKLLCDIVDHGVLEGAEVYLTAYGKVAEKHLQAMGMFYEGLKVEKYVIMPNHIHLLIHIEGCGNEPLRMPVPANSKISRFVGTFKRFCNKEYGVNIWQGRSHDHVIRGEKDYLKIWQYIDNNPVKWTEDCFYTEEV